MTVHVFHCVWCRWSWCQPPCSIQTDTEHTGIFEYYWHQWTSDCQYDCSSTLLGPAQLQSADHLAGHSAWRDDCRTQKGKDRTYVCSLPGNTEVDCSSSYIFSWVWKLCFKGLTADMLYCIRCHKTQLFNVFGVSDVRQTAKPLMPEPSIFEVYMAIEKLKRHKSSGNNQIPAEMIKAGSRIMRSEIHELINSIWNKEELPEEWKKKKKGDKAECCNYRGISLLPTTYKILPNILLSVLTPHAK